MITGQLLKSYLLSINDMLSQPQSYYSQSIRRDNDFILINTIARYISHVSTKYIRHYHRLTIPQIINKLSSIITGSYFKLNTNYFYYASGSRLLNEILVAFEREHLPFYIDVQDHINKVAANPFEIIHFDKFDNPLLLSTLVVEKHNLKNFLSKFRTKPKSLLNYVTLLIDKRLIEDDFKPYSTWDKMANKLLTYIMDSDITIIVVDNLHETLFIDKLSKHLAKPIPKVMYKETMARINKFINSTKS